MASCKSKTMTMIESGTSLTRLNPEVKFVKDEPTLSVKSGSAPTTWDLVAEFGSSLKLEEIENDTSPAFAPKKEASKEEPVDNSNPLKPTASGAGRGTPSTSKSSKGQGQSNDVKSKTTKSGSAPPSGPITEDEVRALLQGNPMTTSDLVRPFWPRLKTRREKDAFAAILKRIARLQKNVDSVKLVFLREGVKSMKDEPTSFTKSNPSTKSASPPASSRIGSGPVTKPVTIGDLEAKFKSRLNLKEIDDDISSVLAPKNEASKEEPVDNKSTASGAGSGTPSTLNSSVGKRRRNGEESKNNRPTKRASPPASSKSGPVTEDEIRALLRGNPMTIRDFCLIFYPRTKTKREKDAFLAISRRILRKRINGDSHLETLLFLREESC